MTICHDHCDEHSRVTFITEFPPQCVLSHYEESLSDSPLTPRTLLSLPTTTLGYHSNSQDLSLQGDLSNLDKVNIILFS